MAEIRVIRSSEARPLMEGDEAGKVYAHTDKIIFATCTIPPGGKGMLDSGHRAAHEVAYVIKGRVFIGFPDRETFVELNAGDAVVIPEGEAHQVWNVGDEQACLTWSTAPHLGRE